MYYFYVFLLILLSVVVSTRNATSPLKLITNEDDDDEDSSKQILAAENSPSLLCKFIETLIPKSEENFKLVHYETETDQITNDNMPSISISPPPRGLPRTGVPKFRLPQLRVPHINVPKLKQLTGSLKPPIVAPSVKLVAVGSEEYDETSAERLEKFKKGIQKMLNVVKILGQIDKYLSERTRIVLEKLAKTLGE